MSESNPADVVSFPASLASDRLVTTALAHARAAAIVLLTGAALFVRLSGIGASGFSEDEINKLRAVQAYSRLDFSANAEHPMLMKLADWASVGAAEWWNGHAGAAFGTISPEAAIRLPNAVAGAATTAVIFLLAEALFDTAVGAWGAVLWAFDVNAAGINRIGKEDTFLLFFLLLGALLYERAKAASRGGDRPSRWFGASGGAFGLMMASKYMPHYFGLHALFNVAADRKAGKAEKRASFYLSMAGAFLLANFAVLLPATWRYVVGYVRGDTVRHSGYAFAHHLYVNAIEASPWGVPPHFYLTFFATKVPIAVLAAAIIGIVWSARHPAHRGATFIRVFLVFTLLPYSLIASKFLRYMLPVLAVVDIAAAVGITRVIRAVDGVPLRPRAAQACAPALVVVAILFPLLAQQVNARPFYGLAQNVIGAALSPAGLLFPDDELYDAGVREAVEAIAAGAVPGAVVCSDATAVVAEYLARAGRLDMKACSIAHDGLPPGTAETWVIAQEGHIYFENRDVIAQIRRRQSPWLDIRVGDVSAAQVFLFRPGVANGR